MTNYPFTGNENQAINFTPSLDGVVYNASVTWNIAGQRWFITITGGNGVRYLTRPLIGSIASKPVNLLFGVFDVSTLVWLESDGIIQVVP